LGAGAGGVAQQTDSGEQDWEWRTEEGRSRADARVGSGRSAGSSAVHRLTHGAGLRRLVHLALRLRAALRVRVQRRRHLRWCARSSLCRRGRGRVGVAATCCRPCSGCIGGCAGDCCCPRRQVATRKRGRDHRSGVRLVAIRRAALAAAAARVHRRPFRSLVVLPLQRAARFTLQRLWRGVKRWERARLRCGWRRRRDRCG